ncbi:large with signal peptide [Cryptosporidium bovis]|uniref:large with signal peptide n=1 Tax=Cryptosporidium bovis TaxID=310047 RepID=UPI003519F20F|nr:large with signal peptide [Cryptosporidium bovis]
MKKLRGRICSISFIINVLIFCLCTIRKIHSRPHITINGDHPTKEEVYNNLYDVTCQNFYKDIRSYNFFGGYPTSSFEGTDREFCIKIEENNDIEVRMREAGFSIDLEDPLISVQFLWTFVRTKYKIFLSGIECFNIWKKVLLRLKLIKSTGDLKYKSEYDLEIGSKPRINPSKSMISLFPSIDDFLLMVTLATIRYSDGKFATDFTGKNDFFSLALIKERMTPLIHSNIKYYVPKLIKMYPPSFKYKDSLVSAALIYRLIYYCTGDIISPREAWEIWGLVMIMGGGGFIAEYTDIFEQVILTQNTEDNFPEERNFFTVLEKLSLFQSPPWGVRFPPIYENNESTLRDHPLFKFFISKGYSLPNKNMKDNEGIAIIYHIFHYYLNIFISIDTSKDIWMIIKRWLNVSREINISNKVKFVQYNGYTTNRNMIIENINSSELPKWASGVNYIDVNSEIMLTYIEEFEYEFPYIVTCPDGDLVLKNNGQGGKGRSGINRNQQVDRLAVRIAKEVHMLLPSIKFGNICELASSLSLKAPIGIKLRSKYIDRINNNINTDSQDNPKSIFSDEVVGIEYCIKGILNLIHGSEEEKNAYSSGMSIVSKHFLEMACQRILKSPLKCSLEFPFYFPFETSDFFNTFAGNVANVMSSTFMGKTNFYNQVIGTIWDGKIQSITKEREFPSVYRLYNPKFNPESLCKFVEGFVNPAIIDYFRVKTQEHIEKKRISEREKQKIASQTKKRYFNKIKGGIGDKLFTNDLYSLKKIINTHKIPKGALLSEWKKFVIDENTISSLITRMFKRQSDFEQVCIKRLDAFLREGNLQFHPVIVEYNLYNEFLINKKQKSRNFFKKISRDDKLDPSLKEIVNFMIFKHDIPELVPELIAQELVHSDIFTREDLQFKNMINWYINDSCQKAYRLISQSMTNRVKRNCFDKFSSCFNFIENSPKPEEDHRVDEKSLREYRESEMKIVQEALEFGLATLFGNYNIDLNISKLKTKFVHNKSKLADATPYTNILNKMFLLTNAAFICIHFSDNMLSISRADALAAAKVASKVLMNYYFDGEVIGDDFKSINKNENNYYNVRSVDLYEEVTSREIRKDFYKEICGNPQTTNFAYEIIETLIRHKNGIESYYDVVDWEKSYLEPDVACQIGEIISEKHKTIASIGMLDENTRCVDYIADKMDYIPHIPVPACTSVHRLLECEDDNNNYNLISTIILSNLLIDKQTNTELSNEVCKLSRIMQLYHILPDFSANCYNLLDKTFNVNSFFLREYKLSSEKKNDTFEKICNELDISHSCNGVSHQKLREDVEKVGNTIIFQIMNEMSEYNLYFGKNVYCEVAEGIAKSDIWNCFTQVEELLSKYTYFEFPDNFEKTICLKMNLWPRKCETEAFENHSIFSVYLYDNVLIPLQDKNYGGINAKGMYFTDICEILEKNYKQNRESEAFSDIKINPKEFCTEVLGENSIYVNLESKLADEMKKCIDIVSTDLLKIANDQLNLEFFDQNNDKLFKPTVFLPFYIVSDFTDLLINNYRLPPRVTIMSIAFSVAINRANPTGQVYVSSTLAIIFISLKVLFFVETDESSDLIKNCVEVSSSKISPTPTHEYNVEICENAINTYQNKKLNEDVYLLYSINEKVSSYYTTPFTSRAIELASKEYIFKVLRGKPSLDIQKVYEKILDKYVDYMFENISGTYKEKDSDGDEMTICTFKRITFSIYRDGKSKEERKEDNLDKFLSQNTYDIEIDGNAKNKVLKAIKMFNFLLELKRIGAIQIHNPYMPISKMINEIRVDSLLSYLPPDLANWLVTFENLEFAKYLFVVPVDYEGDFGPLGKFDQENSELKNVLEREGIFLSNIRHSSINIQAIKDATKKQISPFILSSTAYFLIVSIGEVINYGFRLSTNPYLFRNSIKKFIVNEELLNLVRPKHKMGSITFSRKQFTAVEAIEYFINEKLSTLRLKVDFHWNDINITEDFHKDSLYNFDGKLDSNSMKVARRRIFCDLMTKQLLYAAETQENPFFECKIFQYVNNAYKEQKVHTEGKTFKICSFTGKATKAKKIGENESKKLTYEYLSFLLRGNTTSIHSLSYATKLSPEVILRAIGRIYGHCLIFEEPMNLNFHDFMFKHLIDGDAYFEADIKRFFEPRISTFQKIITTSYKDLDIKKYPTPRMNFENSKKRIIGEENIYYYVDSDEYNANSNIMGKTGRHKEFVRVKNFNNLRFLKRNITKFVLHDKFEVELNSFIAGVSDIIPKRFFRAFMQPNLSYYVQGYIGKNLNDIAIKSAVSKFFFVEDNELLLPHKSKLFNYFITAINSLSLVDIGYFFSIFVNRFTTLLPTAYIGRIKVVEAPKNSEVNPTNRIIINPLQLTVYIPFYSSYSEYEKNVDKLVENQKKILNPIIK